MLARLPVTSAIMFAAAIAMSGSAQAYEAQSHPAASARSAPGHLPTAMADGSDANSVRAQTVEKLALKILASDQVRRAVSEGLNQYPKSPVSNKPDAMRYAKSAIDNTATLAALYAAMGVAPEPTFVWVYAPPRKWHGYTVPGSRWYGDNVDVIYRGVRVDERSRYEFTLHPGKVLPSQLSLMMFNWVMLENLTERSDIPVGTFIVTDETPRNPDGSITLTAGPDPANGRLNYLQLKPGVKQVFVRETRGDGSLPAVQLAVRRTAGPAPRNKSLDELAAETAGYIASGVHATVNHDLAFGQQFDNQLSPLRVRWIEDAGSPDQKLVTDQPVGPDKAWGFVALGYFNLREDEALIMTINTLGAKYLSVNSYRPFNVSPEHVHNTSSLNNYQAKANPDGSITFIFARKDPGTYNWIDSGGIPFGSIDVRWQALTRPVAGTLANGVQLVKTVKLADLRKELPPTTVWVTPAERAAQRQARAKQFAMRCLGTPCQVGGDLDKPY